MSQSSLMVGLLLAAFVLFIAARQRLGTYGSVVFGPKPNAAAPAKADHNNDGKNGTTAGNAAKTTANVVGAAFGVPFLGDIGDIFL